MSTWNPAKNPDRFLAFWHELVKAAPGRHLLAFAGSVKEANAIRNKFGAFKACLKAHPLHASTKELRKKRFRAEIVLADDGAYVYVRSEYADEFAQNILNAIEK